MPESFRARNARSAPPAITFTNDAECQVGQRRQIATRADRSFLRDDRVNPMFQHPEQGLNQFDAAAAMPERQHVRAQEHHRARLRLGEWRSYPAAMAPHQIQLQDFEIGRRNVNIRQSAESGVHSVNDSVLTQHRLDHIARSSYLLPGVQGQPHI